MPGFIGMPEILLLGLVALLLFGPKRLPEMGRGLGKGLREFKDSVSGDQGSHGFHESKLELPQDRLEDRPHLFDPLAGDVLVMARMVLRHDPRLPRARDAWRPRLRAW